MTYAIFDFPAIAARVARRPAPIEHCTACSDAGWVFFHHNYHECLACHNPRCLPCP